MPKLYYKALSQVIAVSFIICALAAVMIVGLVPLLRQSWSNHRASKVTTSASPLNATYVIGQVPVSLVHGRTEQSLTPTSASKTVTAVWGVPAVGDLNNDGVDDAALLLVQNSGGSGTFYYVAAALQNKSLNQFVGTNAVLLGDRIAPQNISVQRGVVLVNYATRKAGQAMSVQPSVGVSKYFVVNKNVLLPSPSPKVVR